MDVLVTDGLGLSPAVGRLVKHRPRWARARRLRTRPVVTVTARPSADDFGRVKEWTRRPSPRKDEREPASAFRRATWCYCFSTLLNQSAILSGDSMEDPSSQNRNALTLVELVVVMTILVALAGLVMPRFVSTTQTAKKVATGASMVAVRDAMMQYWLDTKYVSLPGGTATAASDSDTTALANTNNRFQVRWLFENPANNPTVLGDELVITFDPDSRLGWNGPYLFKPTGRYFDSAGDIDTDGNHMTGTNFSTLYGNLGGPAVLSAVQAGSGVVSRPLIVQAIDNGTTVDCRVVSAGSNGRIDIQHDVSTAALVADTTGVLVGDDEYVSFTLRR